MNSTKRLFRLLAFSGLLCATILAGAQNPGGPVKTGSYPVNGTVTDAVTGEALIGANVVVRGTSIGTATDIDGAYSLMIPSLTDTLVVSYTGYVTQEVAVLNRTTIDVALAVESEVLDEIVVVGYGVQRKSDLTGSIATVKGEEIVRVPSANVEQLLQGKVAGVLVTPSSGQPGDGAIIRIRGTGTLNDASPLFVVDNMLLNDISFLNPSDVESIEVLKDASATAIYGSRGANGVIIITTKKGAKDAPARVNFDAFYGTESVVDRIDLVNAAEYAQLTNELAVNTGSPAPFADPAAFGEGTDWQDVIFRNGAIMNYNLGVSGGSDKSSFNVSANYFKQEGVIRGSDYDRVSLRVNNTYKVNRFLDRGITSLLYSATAKSARELSGQHCAHHRSRRHSIHSEIFPMHRFILQQAMPKQAFFTITIMSRISAPSVMYMQTFTS
jgi:TonB-linked SusC/RagA family outer membrane protein